MIYNLDIYFESPEDDVDDHYIERTWGIVPNVGDTIVDESYHDDVSWVWTGRVRDRLFVTGEDGNLRIQLHCSAAFPSDVKPHGADETIDTL